MICRCGHDKVEHHIDGFTGKEQEWCMLCLRKEIFERDDSNNYEHNFDFVEDNIPKGLI